MGHMETQDFIIRRAQESEMEGINRLLRQVLMVIQEL